MSRRCRRHGLNLNARLRSPRTLARTEYQGVNQTEANICMLLSAVKACTISGDMETGHKIHVNSINSADFANVYVSSTLINMYAKCHEMKEAQRVFDDMLFHNVVSWTTLILGYADNQDYQSAFECFQHMQSGSCSPDARTFVAALKACIGLCGKEEGTQVSGKLVKMKSLEKGMEIHSRAVARGFDGDVFLSSSLVDMYTKCGSMLDARLAFDKSMYSDIVVWNSLLVGYAENGEPEKTLDLFSHMERLLPDARTFVAVLQACANLGQRETEKREFYLDKGMDIHRQALRAGYEHDIFLASTLVDMYAKIGSLLDARKVFDRMEFYNVVPWNALLLGYAENGEAQLALDLFSCLIQHHGLKPDSRSFVAALKACASLSEKEDGAAAVDKATRIRKQAVEHGYSEDIFFANTMLDIYVKCGRLVEAHRVLERMSRRDSVSWTILILGYIENGQAEAALDLYESMREDNCAQDATTFVAGLKACSSLASKDKGLALERGMAIYSEVSKKGLESDTFVANTLVDMYAKCGSMVDARRVFDRICSRTVASWNALMLGYVENGDPGHALELFRYMLSDGFSPDSRSFIASLKACGGIACQEENSEHVKLKSLRKVEEVHSRAEDMGLEKEPFVASSLVDVYAKCGSLERARQIVKSPENVVVMNALVWGYVENGDGETALELYRYMRDELTCGINDQTLLGALNACGSLCKLEVTKEVHGEVCRKGIANDIALATSLVDAYGKCGSIVNGQQVFDSLSRMDLVTWNAMIAGYSHQGDMQLVSGLFGSMRDEGFVADGVTFVSVLTAHSHAGRVEDLRNWLERMVSSYGIAPSIEHYHCLVDGLGRLNRIEEAINVVDSIPLEVTAVTWRIVLSACHKWKDVTHGKVAFGKLVELDDQDAASYMLMANTCGSAIKP